MRKIKLALWISITGLTFFWIIANNLPKQINYFSVRNLINQYSGTLAIGAMSLSMLLAMDSDRIIRETSTCVQISHYNDEGKHYLAKNNKS